MRKALRIAGRQAHRAQQCFHARALVDFVGDQPVLSQGLSHHIKDLPARIQAGIRVLKNHLHAAAHRTLGLGLLDLIETLSIKGDVPLRGRVQAHEQTGHGALAATRLSHQGQSLAFGDAQRQIVYGMHVLSRLAFDDPVEPRGADVEGLAEVGDFDEGGGVGARVVNAERGGLRPWVGWRLLRRFAPRNDGKGLRRLARRNDVGGRRLLRRFAPRNDRVPAGGLGDAHVFQVRARLGAAVGGLGATWVEGAA